MISFTQEEYIDEHMIKRIEKKLIKEMMKSALEEGMFDLEIEKELDDDASPSSKIKYKYNPMIRIQQEHSNPEEGSEMIKSFALTRINSSCNFRGLEDVKLPCREESNNLPLFDSKDEN